MNVAQMSHLNMEEIQILAAAAAAANAAAANVQPHAYAAHASSRQATPPVTPGASTVTTPKASANNTRTPTPTQNGVPSVRSSYDTISAQLLFGGKSWNWFFLYFSQALGNSNLNCLDPQSQSKYQQLLSVIEEMSKDIRPTYAGSKSSAERLKRGIVYARILVKECLVETERSART